MNIINKDRPKEAEIFLQTFELCKKVIQSTHKFSKPTRYTLGYKLETIAIDLVVLLGKISGPNGTSSVFHLNKKKYLENFSEKLDELKILVRLSRELGAYSAGENQIYKQSMDSIGKQVGGILKNF